MARIVRSTAFWVTTAVVVLLIAFGTTRPATDVRVQLSISDFQTRLRDGQIKSAVIDDGEYVVTGKLADGKQYTTRIPRDYVSEVTKQVVGVVPTESRRTEPGWGARLLYSLLPLVIIFVVFMFMLSRMNGGSGKIFSFGKSRARLAQEGDERVTFADVAGAGEAVEELGEIKAFLEDPERFHAIGAKIPRGVLLYGPPGTGKTLLARAVAGEAGVPFFSISGSDFVEMFVGVGASRVRDLFEQAKQSAPCIVFMDEIDAVGRHRGAGLGGGHDEREQTLNQLLVEMDGFDGRSGIILIAATNRPDILDPALLRPGRFDRQITVDRPDLEGRKAILAVHTKGKPLSDDADIDVLARRTPGFTGADLANLVNEAALITARHNGTTITMDELESAIDRVIGGPERKSRVMSDGEKQVIAFHESGHALVGHLLPDANPVHKVSIIARGRALGWTLSLPTEDRNIVSRKSLKAELAMALGGRVAEELVFGEPSTGAANDIEKATTMARAMVTQYGMSDELGPQQLGQPEGEVFLGRQTTTANYSPEIAAKVDDEVKALIDEAHNTARAILEAHRPTLDSLVAALIEKETIDAVALGELWGDLDPWSVDSGTSRKKATSTRKRKPRAKKSDQSDAALKDVATDSAPKGERRTGEMAAIVSPATDRRTTSRKRASSGS